MRYYLKGEIIGGQHIDKEGLYEVKDGELVEVFCTKQKFGSEIEADMQLEEIRLRKIRDNTPIRSYRCPMCRSWHLTSQQKRKI